MFRCTLPEQFAPFMAMRAIPPGQVQLWYSCSLDTGPTMLILVPPSPWIYRVRKLGGIPPVREFQQVIENL